jgi:hypothetical protein
MAVLVPAGVDLISHIASTLKDHGPDLSGCLVVFPGRRPGHFLRKSLANELKEPFIPPRILSIDELIDELYAALHAEPHPDLESIDAVAVLYDIHRSLARSWGGKAFLTLDSFFSLGVKIFNDLEELRIEGVDARSVGEVQPLIGEKIPALSRERLQTLQVFYQEFYRRIEALGFSTRSSRYWQVCENIRNADLSRYNRIILVGFFALTASEKKIFSVLGTLWNAQLVFQEGTGIHEKLREMGIRSTSKVAVTAELSGPAVNLIQSPDGHGQVFALNALLGNPDEHTVIMLPAADTLFPIQRHCLSRIDTDNYNISLGYPLVRTPVFGFLNDLMEVVATMEDDRVYIPRYLTFMLHPYTKNALFKSSAYATRVLIHTLEERLSGLHTRLFTALADIEADESLFETAALGIASDGITATAAELQMHIQAIHRATIMRLSHFANVRDFAERCMDCLHWVSDSTTAPDHSFFSPFAQSVIEAMQIISRSLLGSMSFQDPRSYFTLLRKHLESRYQRFPGTPLRGLQVLGSMETRNLIFERVFVMDAVEGTLPQAGPEDSLLPLSVRRALGLPTSWEREAMEKYYFSVLTHGARELTVFFTDNGKKQKSRFVEELLWKQQFRDRTVESKPYIRPIQYRVNLENRPPGAIEKTDEVVNMLRMRALSASALDAYMRCPLSFYYSRVLGLSKREEVTGEYERTDIGTLVHTILAEFFRPTVGHQMIPGDLDGQRMVALVDRQFALVYGSGDAGAGRLLQGQLRMHLGQFLSEYMAPLIQEAPVTTVAVEERLTREWEGFILTGRLDAVQLRGEALFVIDYKTGHDGKSNAIDFRKLDPERRETWSQSIGSLQLLVYLLLHCATTGGAAARQAETSPAAASNAMFLLLGRNRLNRGIELPLFTDHEEAARELPRLRAVMLSLLREITSPDVPFSPTEDRKRICPTCDFNGICGTRWLSR